MYNPMLNTTLPLSPVITRVEYPILFSPSPTDDILYYPYELNPLPNVLGQGVDPALVLSNPVPQQYEYRYYVNDIDVVLKGSYDDVTAIVNVLNTYPPNKNMDTSNTAPSGSTVPFGPFIHIPRIEVKYFGGNVRVKMNNKMYSGAGSLIMVVEKNRPITHAKFVLFRDINTKQYQETGGKIDKSTINQKIDETILFRTAKKETIEESVNLFILNNESNFTTEISSGISQTNYKVYVYIFTMKNINVLPSLFLKNRTAMLSQSITSNFGPSFHETDRLELFDYHTFINKLNTFNIGTQHVSNGIFMTTYGSFVNVRGRTLKVIHSLNTNKIFEQIFNANSPINVTPVLASHGVSFNEIAL